MPQDQVLAFFLFAVAAAVTPGPSNLMVMAAGAQAGWRGGLPCLAGVVAGMALLMGTAVLGLGSVVQAVPAALAVLRWGGSLWLLWLAWQVASAPPMRRDASSAPLGFWSALAFQWVNPKSWIVGASAAGTFGAAAGSAGVVERAVVLGLTFAAAAAPSCALWLAGGAAMQRGLADPRRARAFNLGMGLLLAASVLLVAL
jgi:threonine/homoserine/homoserine lactone efflux protein